MDNCQYFSCMQKALRIENATQIDIYVESSKEGLPLTISKLTPSEKMFLPARFRPSVLRIYSEEGSLILMADCSTHYKYGNLCFKSDVEKIGTCEYQYNVLITTTE